MYSLYVKFRTSSTPPSERFWSGFLFLLLLLWLGGNKVNSWARLSLEFDKNKNKNKNPHQNLSEGGVLEGWNLTQRLLMGFWLSLRVRGRNEPCHKKNKKNPTKIYQNEVHYRIEIWHWNLTHIIKTSKQLPWMFSQPSQDGHLPTPGLSPTILWMVTHHTKCDHPQSLGCSTTTGIWLLNLN